MQNKRRNKRFSLILSAILHMGALLLLTSSIFYTNKAAEPSAIEITIETSAETQDIKTKQLADLKNTFEQEKKTSPSKAHNISIAHQNKKPAAKLQIKKEAYESIPTKSISTSIPAPLKHVAAVGAGEVKPNYINKLTAWLDKYKIYPHAALEQGKEGRGVLSLTIDEEGHVLSRHIKSSTGSIELDRAIITMATAASPVPKPDVYASLSFDIPVEFRLQ